MNHASAIPRSILAGLCALLLVTALVYIPGLDGPPLLDDNSVLIPLMELEPSGWREWLADASATSRGKFGRPVSMLSFIGNAVLHGNDLRAWKATNVALHLLTGLFVFLLAFRLVRHVATDRDAVQGGVIALVVAGIWLLHPLQVSTVLYTVQRMAQLPALFMFAGMFAYVVGRQRQLRGAAGGWGWVGLAFAICLPLAVLSKENGVLFPPLVFLVELLVFRFAGGPGVRRGLSVLFLLVLLLPAVAGVAFIINGYERVIVAGYVHREFSAYERVLTQFPVLVYYLYLLIVPAQRNMGFYHDDFPVSHGLLDPHGTLVAMLVVAVMLVLALVYRKRAVLPAFGVLFFFVGHSLEASFLSLELFFEHRNYLPAFGIILCVVVLLRQVLHNGRLFAVFGALVLVIMSGLTALRADTWGSFESFVNHAWRVHPHSKRLNTLVANKISEAGDYAAAMEILERFDDAGFAINRLYVKCRHSGSLAREDFNRERKHIQGVLGSHPMIGFINLANAGLDDHCRVPADVFNDLVASMLGMITTPQDKTKLLMYRAHFEHREADLEAALLSLLETRAYLPGSPLTLLLGTEWLIEAGDTARAAEWYDRARPLVARSKMDFSENTRRIEMLLGGAPAR